nr:integrase, catalytic region, zinc finger, CCHC-type, peptidase aspartic, catalytic [Tanacetum cinerariifolium]
MLINFVSKFIGTVRLGNDHFSAIMGYGDLQIGDILILRLYYIEGLGHNLFSVRKFCYLDLEVAFIKDTFFVRNLEDSVATTSYTQNRSLIHTRYNKTPYELLKDHKPDLKFLYVFGALCYPTSDSKDLEELEPKADIGIFIGLVPNQAVSTSAKPPTKNDLYMLFQPMFNEYFKLPSAISTTISFATLPPPDTTRASSSTSIDEDAPSLNTTRASSSTSIDEDAPSPSNSLKTKTIATLIQSTNVEEPINEDEDAYRRHPAKGVGHRVVDSHIGNYLEDDFTPLETIRRPYSVIREKISFELEKETFEPKRRVLRDTYKYFAIILSFLFCHHLSFFDLLCIFLRGEFNDFVALYPVPSEYHVILPKSNQTVFDAMSLENLRLPLIVFFCKPMVVSPLSTSSEGSLICVEMLASNLYGKMVSSGLRSWWAEREPSPRFGIGFPSASRNMEPPKDVEEPEVQLTKVIADSGKSPKADEFVVYLGSIDARIKERKCKTKGGSSRPLIKRKLASRSSSSHVMCAKTCASKDDAPFLSIFDDDDDNVVNRRARELLQVIKKISGKTDVIKARERSREEECKGLRVKCESLMAEFDQSPAVLALQEKISPLIDDVKEHKDKARLKAVEASLRREVEKLKQDRRDVVLMVIPYAAMELVHSDKLGRLVGKLVSFAITYGRCGAYEQVTAMKEPFDLSKAKGYRSSYQKDHTQASNDFATATFLWLDEFVADATALIETLLSKKPPMLQKPAPLRTQMPMPSS